VIPDAVRGGEELFTLEHKSIADLVGCGVDEKRVRLLAVGSSDVIERGVYRSAIAPKAVVATLAAIEARCDVPGRVLAIAGAGGATN
jgi:hypothetical protein